MTGIELIFGANFPDSDAQLRSLLGDGFAGRLFEQDSTLWGEEAEAEAAIRLGWTDFEGAAETLIPGIESLRAELIAQGVDRIVLCGMGGSSLAPAVIASSAAASLTVLDSTHPTTIARELQSDLDRIAVVVSSKSGSTIETRSHLAAFTQAFRNAGIDPASRLVIVTDPGSPLDKESRAAGLHVFNADPNVGGRFSALTAFGLVPCGLAGADLRGLIAEAQIVRASLAENSSQNPALRLAAALAVGLPEHYVLAIRAETSDESNLASWIEQLIAESTGKNGVGVLPIALPATAHELRVPPRNTLPLRLGGAPEDRGISVAAPLGAQFLLWEVATAALGRLMGIDPFDQPDVESAKVAARAALSATETAQGEDAQAEAPQSTHPVDTLPAKLRESVDSNGYLVIQAYLDRDSRGAEMLDELRERLAAALGVPVALGWGPRYLHSTGQLHKGGPALGMFLQVIDEAGPEIEIPGLGNTFGELISAQAAGDRDVLAALGRPVFRVRSEDLSELLGLL